jgi:diaminohydroxyphosphoribosylaminopyrimidine deaminase/5-amino-6-(5-phosphoribosylamino)uracil reductase
MRDEAYTYMRMALSLAKKGIGLTSPNPMVGAVLVKNKRVVGRGYHRRAGLPHAEINAISNAMGEAKGSTLYVNLEPCVHAGKTPPCVDAIIKAGIKRVVLSMLDPNPMVNGKGVELLKKANIDVKVGVLEQEARRLNEAFIVYMEKGRPFLP